MKRREFVALAGYAAFLRRGGESPSLTRELAQIERRVRGRLGVAVLDTNTGTHAGYRTRDRFPMCSTFKWLLAAHVLSRVDAATEQLTRVIPYGPADLLEYAPITRAHVAEGGMAVSALCEAAVEYSDNTAANLLLASIGGPAALTHWLRDIGDPVTRLDRNEPSLNSATPGDPRDTTTPDAMIADLRRILLGDALAPASRDRLIGWLQANTTGAARLRAGMPPDWRIGDKTGTGSLGSTNDVAIATPPGRASILVAAYLTGTDADAATCNAALADVGRAVTVWMHAPAPLSTLRG